MTWDTRMDTTSTKISTHSGILTWQDWHRHDDGKAVTFNHQVKKQQNSTDCCCPEKSFSHRALLKWQVSNLSNWFCFGFKGRTGANWPSRNTRRWRKLGEYTFHYFIRPYIYIKYITNPLSMTYTYFMVASAVSSCGQGERGAPGLNGTQGHQGCPGKRGLKV